MSIPSSYVFEDPESLFGNSLRLIKPPSYFEEAKKEGFEEALGETTENQPLDWKQRLSEWRDMLQSKGTIKDFDSLEKEVSDFGIMACLAYLLSPVTSD